MLITTDTADLSTYPAVTSNTKLQNQMFNFWLHKYFNYSELRWISYVFTSAKILVLWYDNGLCRNSITYDGAISMMLSHFSRNQLI